MVSKRINLKVHSLARLIGGSVSIAGDVDIDGVETAVQVVVDADGWERIRRNANWFHATRTAPEGRPSPSEGNEHG